MLQSGRLAPYSQRKLSLALAYYSAKRLITLDATEVVTKLVSHAGNAYISKTDFELLEKIWDLSKWSQKMREPLEQIYGKVGRQWKTISCKQSDRWQHASQLKAISFCS